MSEITTSTETRKAKCEDHGDYEERVFSIGETQMKSKCPECDKIKTAKRDEEEQKREDGQKKYKTEALFRDATIPQRFKGKEFNDYIATCDKGRTALDACRNYANNFDKRLEAGGGMVLCGKPGTGKTHLAASIANHVIQKFCKAVVFSSVISAMRRVKSTYSRDSQENESDAIKAYTMPDLLILDEVGVQFGSDAEKMILFEIINIRYQNMKPTILISNLPHNELNDYIGERVVDRMREGGGAIIPFDWESYRNKL